MSSGGFGAAVFVLLVHLVARSPAQQFCYLYRDFPRHTMCVYRERACPGGNLVRLGLSADEQTEMLGIHNSLRSRLVRGDVPGAPPALAMPTMRWDNELSAIAQRLAEQCVMMHDQERSVPRFRVGQNLYQSTNWPVNLNLRADVTTAALAWFNEVVKPGFPPSFISPFKFVQGVGHYTQMAWANSSLLGCGFAMYTTPVQQPQFVKRLYVCNYGPTGNVIGDQMYAVRKLH